MFSQVLIQRKMFAYNEGRTISSNDFGIHTLLVFIQFIFGTRSIIHEQNYIISISAHFKIENTRRR